jgi:hypothetical protein
LPTERGEVEEVVSSADRLTAATVGGIGVENFVAVSQKATQPGPIEWLFVVEIIGYPV